MNITEELQDVIKKHTRWKKSLPGGKRAVLTGKNLTSVNLAGIDLSEAVIVKANLTQSHLRGINLSNAVMKGTIFARANLDGAILSHADMSETNLLYANLTNADMRKTRLTGSVLAYAKLNRADATGANFTDVDLRYTSLVDTNLNNTILDDTCLDKRLYQAQKLFLKECPMLHTGGRIVYRTKRSQNVGSTTYIPGHTYVAPYFSFSSETACHPGIYAASLNWIKRELSYTSLVRCYVREGDWVITAKGTIRCKRLRILDDWNMYDIPCT